MVPDLENRPLMGPERKERLSAMCPAKKAKLNLVAPDKKERINTVVTMEKSNVGAPARKGTILEVAVGSELVRGHSVDERSTSHANGASVDQSVPCCETENPDINITDRMNIGEGQDGDVTEDPSGSSSSFGDTVSGDDGASPLSEDEIDSQLGGGAQPSWLYSGYEEAFRLRKKKVTSHWRDFIRPLMVKCKWAELKMKRFQSQASMYNRLLAQYDRGRLSQLETSGSRSLPFPHHRIKGDKTMQRKKRKRVEETTDATSYMLKHNVFSHYETKGSSEENMCMNNGYTHSVKSENDRFNTVEYEHLLEFGDEENSLAQIFMKIDAMQARVHNLTSRVDKVIRENPGKFSVYTSSLFDPSESGASTDQDPSTPSCDKDLVLWESPTVIPQPMPVPLVEELNVPPTVVTNELAVEPPLSIVEVADQPVAGKAFENVLHVPSKKNSSEIPTPNYLIVDTYERDYSATFMQPAAYLCAQGARAEIGEFVEYDLDNEDEDWLQEFNCDKAILAPEKLESILFKLEVLDQKAREKTGIMTYTFDSPVPVHLQLDTASEELQGQLIQYSVIQAVYSYWKEKRERWQKPVLRRLQLPPPVDDTNPYNVFRPREKKPPPPVNETNPYRASRIREKAHKLHTRRREKWQKPVLRRFQPPPPVNDTNPYKVYRPREKAQKYHTRRRERWQKPVLRRLQPPPPVKDTNSYSEACRPREKAHKLHSKKPPPLVIDTDPDNVSIPRENKDYKLDTTKEQQQLPEWLNSLLSLPFFKPCSVHNSSSKNEMNVFCVDCCLSLCRYCLPSHSTHRLLQIRRYVYNDVLKLDEAEKLFNCKSIQPYTVNNWRVVFLNKRDTTRSPSSSEHTCASCDRNLKDQYLFCSMSCKVDYILTVEGIDKLVNYLRHCDSLTLPDVAFGGGSLTPDSVLEPDAAASSTVSTRNPVVSTDASSDDAGADEKPLKRLLITGGWPDCIKRGMASVKKRRMLTRKQTGINLNVCQAEDEKSSCFTATRHSSRLAGSGKRLASNGLNLALRS